MPEKKFYITTSIAYTNAPPHIGFSLEIIQADVIARFYRLLGKDTFFLTGTDEHGTKIAKAAEKAGKNPKNFTDEISEKFKKLNKTLNLSNNDFIRTTDQKRHWPAVRKAWLELKKRGDIYKKKYKGLYCSGCEAFITKRDLANGKCIIHQKKPQLVEEENYFFRLSRYSEEIAKVIEKKRIKVIPETRKNEVLNFIKQGLEDISFSRPRKNLKWGIPVPDDKNQTIYVWCDALINYLSALGYAENSKKFKKYWPADVHCIGKDILKFHAVIWPGILFSLKLPLPKIIFVHGFISVGGQKMSKSLGNIIDPFKLVGKYGAEAVRYYLLREIPPTKDGDFTYDKFEQRYNSDLAKGLGNLLARTITLGEKFKIKNSLIKDKKLKNRIEKIWKKYILLLEEFKFNEALILIWDLISFCDRYIEKNRLWEKSEKQKEMIGNLLILIKNIANLLLPFLPETSEKIFTQLGTKLAERKWFFQQIQRFVGKQEFKIKKGKPLFPRII